MLSQTGRAAISCQRTNSQKVTACANLWAFDIWKSWAQKTFLFREPQCDSVPELMISRQIIELLVIVSRYGNTSTI